MWNSELQIQICKFYDYSQTIKSNEIIKPNENKLKETTVILRRGKID